MKKLFYATCLALSIVSLSSCKFIVKDSSSDENSNVNPTDDNTTAIISSYTETYNIVKNSCFGVRNKLSQSSQSIGSCVCIKSDSEYSYFITNRHVIEAENSSNESTNLYVYFGSSNYYSATLMFCTTYNQRQKSSADDLALLRVATPGESTGISVKAIEISDNVITKGTQVISVGCPLSLSNYNTLTEGVVSKVLSSENLYMHTATINPGNSGGGLFTLDGKLIGLNVSGNYKLDNESGYYYNTVDDMYNAISYEHIKDFLNDNDFEL